MARRQNSPGVVRLGLPATRSVDTVLTGRLLPRSVRCLALAAPLLLFAAAPAAAAVEALFDLSSAGGGPFPSDRFTVSDHRHLTGLRVDLPKPDCAVRVTDCADIDVINTLDGFNLQPRAAPRRSSRFRGVSNSRR